LPNHQIEDDTTRATAHLPGLEIEIIHRRSPHAGVEQISINLQAMPSFEAFGRFLETINPFALWVQAAQMAWLPWLGAARTLMLPWSDYGKFHQRSQSHAERVWREHQEEALDDALKNTFPASDPVSIVQPAPRGADFDSVNTGGTRSMDEREAFWAAIYKLTSSEWSPTFADQPTFDVKGKYLTIRQVCELVKDITEELPYLVAGEVMKTVHDDHRLAQLFAPSPTYATGSQCLIQLLEDRVARQRDN
jgi:hypothetical protein